MQQCYSKDVTGNVLHTHIQSLMNLMQAPVACILEDSQLGSLKSQLDKLQAAAEADLIGRRFQAADLTTTRYLNLRFQGTDVALMVAADSLSDYEPAFLRMYQQEFGFVLQARPIVVDDARCAPCTAPCSPAYQGTLARLGRVSCMSDSRHPAEVGCVLPSAAAQLRQRCMKN